MRRSEVSATAGIEQIFYAIEVEKEGVAAAAREKRIGAGFDDVGFGAEGYLAFGDNLVPDSFGRARFRAFGDKDGYSLLAVLRRRKHIAERDIGQAVSVIVDIEAVDGVRVERVRGRVCIEDQHGPRRIRGSLEGIEIADIQ